MSIRDKWKEKKERFHRTLDLMNIEIENLAAHLDGRTDLDSQEYEREQSALERLVDIRDTFKADGLHGIKPYLREHKDEIVELIKGGFGIAGLLLILKFEKFDVITSKAFQKLKFW